jgi:hypothetical protein
MKKNVYLLFILVFASGSVHSQTFFTRKKEKVKSLLEKFYADKNITPFFQETDSSLTILFKDSTGATAKTSYSYYFNKNGRCYKETGAGDCTNCFDAIVKGEKTAKRYGWKKISDHLYISKPFWQMAIVYSKNEDGLTYSVINRYLNRNEHSRMYRSKS